jgi:hypothetical protein
VKAERCQAVTKSGKSCSATVVADGMCAGHAPSWAERRRQWSAEGGRRRSNAARARKELPAGVMTNDELRGLVGLTIKGVLAGRVEPGIGNSVAALSRAYVAVTEAGAVETLEREVAELRDLIAARGMA